MKMIYFASQAKLLRSSSAALLLAALLVPVLGNTQQQYQKPPKEVQEVLDAKLAPGTFLSPARDTLLLVDQVRYPAVSVLAEPTLRTAGARVNTRTNAESSYPAYSTGFTLKKLPDGAERRIELPQGMRIKNVAWNPKGTRFAFANEANDGLELWVADVAAATAKKIPNVKLNSMLGNAFSWLPDSVNLVARLIPDSRGAPPAAPTAPPGPRIESSDGVKTASSTYEVRDVLKTPHDAALFDYYATSQPAIVNAESGARTLINKSAVYSQTSPSPDGKYLLVQRVELPYSYQRTWNRFPRAVEVWTLDGNVAEAVAKLPLAESVPIDGVETGPRNYFWRATAPSTLMYYEALDGGDPNAKVPHRDKLMQKVIGGPAREVVKVEERLSGVAFLETGGGAMVYDYDRNKRWLRTFLLDADSAAPSLQLLRSMSIDERYENPGDPVYRMLPSGAWAIMQQGDTIFLNGEGQTASGSRPFLDRFNLRTKQTERLFRSDGESLENFIAMVDAGKGTFLTLHQSPKDPPNILLRTLGETKLANVAAGEATRSSNKVAVTRFPDPTPQIRGIEKRIVSYERPDGVKLSFTLYTPPGYKAGTRLPTVFYAYPLDYADGKVAGQVDGSSKQFTTLRGTSHLFFLLRGYAVLDDVAMPVVGPPSSAYDTFIEQLTANAKAAVDKAVELGVTDRDRIGVMGHSHGALMTANLLAYTDLFRAGIARSGAYNHTLRPFGFQNEKRTLYQAKDVYIKLSPVLNADKIKKPILLIHGEIDQNPGTVPMQSEKLYEALRGVGATARLVMLPYENHGYLAKESTEHVLYEMLSWFDKYVKEPKPTATAAVAEVKP
jgi:dipeptidyl aminopeptidase/acylaminoacyl peptidase